MHGHVDIAMALYAAIVAKGQDGREHIFHINHEFLDALGVAAFYGRTEVVKSLFSVKCPSIFLDPEDRSLAALRKNSKYAPFKHCHPLFCVPVIVLLTSLATRYRSLLHIAIHSNRLDTVAAGNNSSSFMLLFSLVYASTAVYSLRPVIKLSSALVNDVDPRDGSTPLHAAGKIIPNFSLTQHTQSESVTIFITLSSV
jgi:hypothetical protein